MKYLIPFLLFPFSLFAQNTPQCPSESFVVEFISPITKAKKAFCAYQKNGATIKHGEEIVFGTDGTIKQRLNYQHGAESKNIPGTEESSAAFTDSLIGKKSQNEEQEILSTISEMMAILTLKKTDAHQTLFKVSQCDDNPMAWVQGAILGGTINKTYAFKINCDVNGSFSADFKNDFPVKFELRNLRDFNRTEMTVKMKVQRSPREIRYGFEVLEGLISSPTRTANFKAVYEVEVNPKTGNTLIHTQSGKVTLTKLNNSEVNVSAPWKYDR